jgi:glycine/D-amino acid oxidase-like deaminating enzyme
LRELQTIVGPDQARRAYQLGVQAITQLGEIAADLPVDTGFRLTPSLYVTRRQQEIAGLREETDARAAAGLEVEFVERARLRAEFGIEAKAGILSAAGARLDPYRFTYAVFEQAQRRGVRIYDRTPVTAIQQTKQGVQLMTESGCTITARKVVFATGYESQDYLRQRVTDLDSTYALVSEPLEPAALAQMDYLYWETARPYFYLRTTADHRIILGGADEPFRNPEKRDRLIGKKAKRLLREFAEFFPSAPPLDVAFAWAGTFGSTKDGLAYIGETAEFPNAYFALGYGGNGITYGMIAAHLIVDAYLGRPNPNAALFRFDR